MFNVVIASANVAAIYAIFRAIDSKGLLQLDAGYRYLLTIFFMLGTVQVILALFGKVWFTAQLLGFLFVALAYLCAIELNDTKAFIAVGFFMACAMLTRNHLIFTGIWPAYYLLAKNWNDRPRLYFKIALALLSSLLLGALFLFYNQSRFGSPF